MKNHPLPLLLIALLTLVSCGIPVLPHNGSPTERPTETTLVLRTEDGARGFADQWAAATYLALELKLLSGTTTKYASAIRDGEGNFVVTIAGLVAGDWRLRAYFYESEASGSLLLYARQTEYLAPGQVRTDITLALYEPGALGSTNPGLDLDAHHIGLAPDGPAHANSASPRSLTAGSQLRLAATVFSAEPTGVPDEYELASSQTVVWSSSDPEVAIVSSSGLVTALATGEASISAESMDNALARQSYYVKVVPGLEGSWKNVVSADVVPHELFRFHDGRWSYFTWDPQVDGVPRDPASFAYRGSYTLQEDLLVMVTESILLPGSVEWVEWIPQHQDDYEIPQFFRYSYSVSGDNLLVYTKGMSGGGAKVMLDSGDEGTLFYDQEFSGYRLVEDPLLDTEVTLPQVGPVGGVLAASQGDVIDLKSVLGTATLDQLVWVSENPAVFDFWNDGYVESNTANLGTTTLRAYALGTLDYEGTLATSGVQPLVTLTLTVAAPPDTFGPTITTSDLTSNAGYQATMPFSFTVSVSDPSGVSNLVPTITIDGGSIVPDAITEVGAGVYSVDVPGISGGAHSVEITAQDTLANPTTETFTLEVAYI